MNTKIRDIAVKTGTYKDSQGQEKGRWQNVGALMKGDDGNEFIILQRWFNPAGIANPENRESVVLSCFRIDDKSTQAAPSQPAPATAPTQPQGTDSFDDDIPF